MKTRKLDKPVVEDLLLTPEATVKDLIEYYRGIHGFMAAHLAEAVDILRKGMKAEARFLAFTGNLVATGLRRQLAEAVRRRLFNVVITTCGAIDHDIARGMGGLYYKGMFEADDVELDKKRVHRLGNIFIPFENYGPIVEKAVFELLDKIADEKKVWGGYELLWKMGSLIEDEASILRASYENKIPVIVPGIVDGAFGTAVFMHSQKSGITIDLLKDMKLLSDIVFTSKTSTALIIGGGISKHHTIWWNQFKDGLDYVVYVTTAVEYDGSLSGAMPREAISWGKIKENAKRTVVYGDATLIVPLIIAALLR